MGYAGLTLDSVAARAGTSRPVLARRWRSRAELLVAALDHYRDTNPIAVPDLGNLRDELIVLMTKMSERGQPAMGAMLFGLGSYFDSESTNFASLRGKLHDFSELNGVLERAVARGEIDPAKLTARIVRLPVDLVRHETILTNKPVSAETVAEILDAIFLPLVKARR